MSHSDPWSVHNLRSAHDWSPDGPESKGRPPPDGSDVIQSKLDTVAEAAQQITVSDEESPRPLQANPPADVVKCDACDQEFTGRYRRRNLVRHRQHKHSNLGMQGGSVTYPCPHYGCSKVFSRVEYTLRHERTSHPKIQYPPVLQRPTSSQWYNSGADLDDDNLEASAQPKESAALTEVEHVLQDAETVQIWEQGPVNFAGPLPNLSNSGVISHVHDQYTAGVISSEHLLRATNTDDISTSERSSLQHVSDPHSEDFEHVTRCCPVQDCATRTSFYQDFVRHFRREHTEALHGSTSKQCCLSGCGFSFLHKEEDDVMKHMWDFHMLSTYLDAEMNDLDLGAESEISTAWSSPYTKEIPMTSSKTPEHDSAPTKSHELSHSVVKSTSGASQSASPHLEREECVSEQSAPLRMAVAEELTGNEPSSTSIANSDSPAEGQLEASTIMSDSQILPSFGQSLIDRLGAELEPQVHLQLWTSFFNRWEGIIEVLKSRRSESYHWFAPVLETIRQNVQLHGADTSDSACSEGQRAHTNNESRPGAAPTRKRSNSGEVASGKQKRAKGAVDPAGDNKDEVQVEHAEETTDGTFATFDCIIHKHHLMHQLPGCPCKGANARFISHLQYHHLIPERSDGHGGLIRFLGRCKSCNEFFFDKQRWTRHRAVECDDKPKKQNEGVAEWARLYLAQYPDARQIPNPYKGQNTWLTNAECEAHRQSVLAILPPTELASGSFLDDRSVAEAEPPSGPSDTSAEAPFNEELGRSAAYHIMLRDLSDQLSLMTDGMPTLTPDMPAQSHEELFTHALRTTCALAYEGARSDDPNRLATLATLADQAIRFISACLPQGPPFAPTSIRAVAGPSSGVLNERRDFLPPSSETVSSRSTSAVQPNTQGRWSGSTSHEVSTQTGPLSDSDFLHNTKVGDEQDFLLQDTVPVAPHADLPIPYPESDFRDDGPDPTLALPWDENIHDFDWTNFLD